MTAGQRFKCYLWLAAVTGISRSYLAANFSIVADMDKEGMFSLISSNLLYL